jgi:hypothetical protein
VSMRSGEAPAGGFTDMAAILAAGGRVKKRI